MMKQKVITKARATGQAIVEFALMATLIFMMLAATVDLGLIFFTLQGLHNAAQEGAMYGSRWIKTDFTLDKDGIRERARLEAGNSGIGFVNLLDLNNDGIRDISDAGVKQINPKTGRPVIEDYIDVRAIIDADADGDPLNDGTAPNYTPCPTLASYGARCHILVVMRFDYNFFFPFAPAFSDSVQLRSSYVVPMRN
jgi:hypothetical protein